MNLKDLKNKRGITLIALVITIIVLLILAGITIKLAIGQDGIIKIAQDAGQNDAQEYEDEQAKIKEINNEMKEIKGNGNGQTAVDRTGLNVGDYIDYAPDTAEGTVYSASKLAESITGFGDKYSGYNTDVPMDDLDWQILRIYDDGSMDLIGSVTSTPVSFRNAIGYNNGVYVMNDICKTLYSRTSAGITARSVNIEDIEYWLQKDADGKTLKDKYTNDYGYSVGDTEEYTESSSKYPTLWARQTGAKVNRTVTTGGISESDDGYTTVTDETYLPTSPTSSDSITVTQTYWDTGGVINQFNETNFGAGSKVLNSSKYYWVASRYSDCRSDNVLFGLYSAKSYVTSWYMFTSTGNGADFQCRFRPVVHLNKYVKITASSTATDSSTPHHIESY